MKNKTVFISHPISGDIEGNVKKVLEICRKIHTGNIISVAPYLVSLGYLDDEIAEDRELGIEANLEALRRGFIDELWLFGERISKGMEQEIQLAMSLNIRVVPKTMETKKDLEKLLK